MSELLQPSKTVPGTVEEPVARDENGVARIIVAKDSEVSFDSDSKDGGGSGRVVRAGPRDLTRSISVSSSELGGGRLPSRKPSKEAGSATYCTSGQAADARDVLQELPADIRKMASAGLPLRVSAITAPQATGMSWAKASPRASDPGESDPGAAHPSPQASNFPAPREISKHGLADSKNISPDDFRRRLAVRKWTIHPRNNPYTGKWDILLLLLLLFVCCFTPYQVAFMDDDLVYNELTWLIALNYIIDGIFGMDMIFQFFIQYPIKRQKKEEWIQQHSLIAVNYMRGWFLIDFLSVFPFNEAYRLSNGYPLLGPVESGSELRAVKVIRGVRLLKIARVLRAGRIMGRRNISSGIIGQQKLELLKILCLLFITGHWIGCVFGFAGSVTEPGNPELSSWILDKDPELLCIRKHFDLWVASIYWSIMTITSIGYGDIVPGNTGERAIAILCMLAAAFVWAIIIGCATAIMSSLIKSKLELSRTMDRLNAMMVEKDLPRALRHELRLFFTQAHKMENTHDYFEFLRDMSPELRKETCTYVNGAWTKNVWFFSYVSQDFMAEATQKFTPSIYAKGENFGRAQVLYILNSGLVGTKGRVFGRGRAWGFDVLLECLDLCEDPYAMALTETAEVLSLTRKQLKELIDEFPEDKVKLRKCTVRLALIRGIMKKAETIMAAEAEKLGSKTSTTPPKPRTSKQKIANVHHAHSHIRTISSVPGYMADSAMPAWKKLTRADSFTTDVPEVLSDLTHELNEVKQTVQSALLHSTSDEVLETELRRRSVSGRHSFSQSLAASELAPPPPVGENVSPPLDLPAPLTPRPSDESLISTISRLSKK